MWNDTRYPQNHLLLRDTLYFSHKTILLVFSFWCLFSSVKLTSPSTFPLNWLFQSRKWGLFICHDKKEKYLTTPFFYNWVNCTPTPLLFEGSGSTWDWPVVLGCAINESFWMLPSPSDHATVRHASSHTVLLREGQTGPRWLCQPWLCPDSTSGREALVEPPSSLVCLLTALPASVPGLSTE